MFNKTINRKYLISRPLKYEEDISDYMLAFVYKVLEDLEKENFFDNWDIYENVDEEKTVSVIRQRTDTKGGRRGVVLLEKLESLKTKKAVREEIYYLLDGYMPELDEHPIGKKLNKLYKLINETTTKHYDLKEKHKKFVDRMRHWIRHQLNFKKYTMEEIENSKILDYPPTKDNLKECNRIYKDYMKERKEEAQRRFM